MVLRKVVEKHDHMPRSSWTLLEFVSGTERGDDELVSHFTIPRPLPLTTPSNLAIAILDSPDSVDPP